MKKTFIALFAIAAIGGTIASCKKEKTVDCVSAATNATKALEVYMGNQSVANCKNYKAALQDYINSSCFASLSAEQKASYQESVNALTCE
ncbi:MAG: hypothetical protein IT249_12990 [Chitinophagaceae bacterium]|nr:hypothetical protein [Chitinophagaceae bacterium]